MDPLQTARSCQETIAQLERTEADWSRIDMLLRRLVTRLSYAAEGRAPQLDRALWDIRLRVREPVREEALEPLLAVLADAVKVLDEVAGASGARPLPGLANVMSAGEMLLVLLDRLRLDDAATAELDALRQAVTEATDTPTLARQAETVAELVNRQLRRIDEQKVAAKKLLMQVSRQLEELALYMADEDADHRDGSEARLELDSSMTGEIDALGYQVEEACDLAALQQVVQARLGALTGHLKVFRERENARERAWQERAERMGQRIRELERSAQTMEADLRQEQQLAATDPLTGIANRLVFEQHMARACTEVTRTGAEISLLVLDIDRFKHINDRFGHTAGDRALRIVAEQLRAGLRPADLLARYGGEEFAVILPDTTADAALRLADSLRLGIEKLGFHGQQRPVRITFSCGVTALQAGDTPDSAFGRADRALYAAKRAGRNRCEVR
jgi:diguanylate cyclase